MLTLFQLPNADSLPVSSSPFCAKLEIYLRLTDRPYRSEAGDPRKSPNKKVPYVRFPDGSIDCDSHAIIGRLEEEGPAIDKGLSGEMRNESDAIERTAENDLYFACLFSRFSDPDGWAHQKVNVRAMLPPLLGRAIAPLIRSSQVKRCERAGFASTDDYTKGVQAVEQLERKLGDKPYFLGDEPHIVDCSVWGPLVLTAANPADSPLRTAVRTRPALVGFLHRLADRASLTIPTFA